MKKNNIARLAFFLAVMMLVASCGETYIEENQNAYKATDVIPVVLGVSGPAQVLQTFSYDFAVTYDRAGSSWAWSSADATISSVSTDTKSAHILFDQLPAGGKAYIDITETTSGGNTSALKSVEVTVNPFCPLVNGVADLVGTWSGIDGTASGDAPWVSMITSTVTGTTLVLDGIGQPFIENYWGEGVIDGGTCNVTINPDGTLVIPRQYIFTTEWDGDPYDYDIVGTGNWDNCGATPTLVIQYDIIYSTDGDGDGLVAYYSGYGYFDTPYLIADIALD
jgi:hypothetical protein